MRSFSDSYSHSGDRRDDENVRNAVHAQYLYHGPSKAMDMIYKDLCRIIKNSKTHPTQENIDHVHFLSIAVSELSKLSFSPKDTVRAESFRFKCSQLFSDDSGVFESNMSKTPYDQAVSRLYNALYIFNPASKNSHDPLDFPDDGVVFHVIDGVVRLLERFDATVEKLTSFKEHITQKKKP